MKRFLLLNISFFMLLNTAAFAEKIVIVGPPMILERKGDVYFLPNSYKPTTPYYYVFADGTRYVCYLEKQPELNSLDLKKMNLNFKGSLLDMTCYYYDPNYFKIL